MKRAQTSTIDLIFALSLLFVVGVLVANHDFGLQAPPQTISDAQTLAQAIYAPYPQDYNQSTVIVPGFVVNHRINETLFTQFQNTNNVQRLLGINSEYWINTSLGSAGVEPTSASDVYVINRYAARNGSIEQIEVVAWTD